MTITLRNLVELLRHCRIAIYISSSTHYCVEKAIKVAGMSECKVRMVDTVERKMCVRHLQQRITQDEEVYIVNILLAQT